MDNTAQLLLLCGLPHATVGSLSDAWYLSDRFGTSCHVTERNVIIIIFLKIWHWTRNFLYNYCLLICQHVCFICDTLNKTYLSFSYIYWIVCGEYSGPYLPQQNLLFHGKTYFYMAKLIFPRQNLLFHGKTYFSTAKLTFPRQNLLFHGKTYFSMAKFTFPRQNLRFRGKIYFFTAKLTYPRQNFIKGLEGICF